MIQLARTAASKITSSGHADSAVRGGGWIHSTTRGANRPDRPMPSRFDAAGGTIPTQTLAVRGGLAVVASLLLNWVLLGAALASGVVEPFDALSIPPVSLLTALGAIGATIAYGVITRRSDAPDRTFAIVAGVVLLLSFVPDVALLENDPEATVSGVIVLILMHVAVAAVCVLALTDRFSPIAR